MSYVNQLCLDNKFERFRLLVSIVSCTIHSLQKGLGVLASPLSMYVAHRWMNVFSFWRSNLYLELFIEQFFRVSYDYVWSVEIVRLSLALSKI